MVNSWSEGVSMVVSAEFKALVWSDLAKIFAAIISYLLAFLLLPVIFPLLFRILDFSTGFGTYLTVYVVIILFCFWTVFLFLAIFVGTQRLIRKYGIRIRRSDRQEYGRIIMIVVGFVLAAVLITSYLLSLVHTYTSILEGTITLPTFEIWQILFWAFELLTVTIATVIFIFIGTVYGCILLNDFVFFLARKIQGKQLKYDLPAKSQRHFGYLKLVTLLLIIIVAVTAGIIYLLKPTTFRFQYLQGEQLTVNYHNDTGGYLDIKVFLFSIYTSPLEPEFAKNSYILEPYSTSLVELIEHTILILDELTRISSKYYESSFPQGHYIVGYKLMLLVNSSSFMTEIEYAADLSTKNTACTYISKRIFISQIDLYFQSSGQLDYFTFNVTIMNEFRLGDLFG